MSRRLAATVLTALTACGVLAATPVAASAADAGPTPVASVSVPRYLGHWYQVAAIPALYELQCAKNSAADYTLNADATIAVRNSCATWINTTSTVNGTARVDNAPANSALSVSFFSFLGKPVYTGTNYVIFGLDPNYRWAVVGDPKRQSGFVLSRTPALTAAQTATIRSIITANGYDPCRLRYTPQDGGSSSRAPFC